MYRCFAPLPAICTTELYGCIWLYQDECTEGDGKEVELAVLNSGDHFGEYVCVYVCLCVCLCVRMCVRLCAYVCVLRAPLYEDVCVTEESARVCVCVCR